MRIHLIAIGGSAMHTLAIALKQNGHEVSGSDDEIFEPSKSNLKKHALLPKGDGWDENCINRDLDAVILGMHAHADNPELKRAQELGIKIYSYPEFVYEHCRGKKRVVIGGSHGKTTITSMILHVLKAQNMDFDFLVGAAIPGFDNMVRLSDAPVIIIEGDEYLSSPIDKRPKFHHYHPHLAVISGIAWDHINVFKTFDDYIRQFRNFIKLMEPGAHLYWCADDEVLQDMMKDMTDIVRNDPYTVPDHLIRDGKTFLLTDKGEVPLSVFGRHNLLNLSAARAICLELGVSEDVFYSEIQSFKGASKRLEPIGQSSGSAVFKDFAHAPSKVRASIGALKEQWPGRRLIACLELHTYSSLNKIFLSQYKNSMKEADVALVFYSAHALEMKRMQPLAPEVVKESFGDDGLRVLTSRYDLEDLLYTLDAKDSNLLLMSSGTFDGMNMNHLARHFTGGKTDG